MKTLKKTLVICSIVAVFFLALYFLYISRTIILYLLIALLLAIAVNPLMLQLKKWNIKRVGAALLSILFLLVILLGILGTIVTPLIVQGISFAKNLPAITQTVLSNPTFSLLNQKYNLASSLDQFSSNASAILLGGSASLFLIASNILLIVSSISVILVLTFLLLIEGEKIWEGFLHFLREDDVKIARRIGSRIMKAISGFVSGNLLISLIAGLVTLITLWILRIPYMFALAALVALFDLIPLIGTAIATIAVALVALTKGLVIAIIAVGVLLIYQFVEGHLIQPVVYSRSISLSALLIVIASLIGAEIAGIVGILLAIPVAAVIQIVVTEIYTSFKTLETH